MAKNTGFSLRELSSVSSIHMVVQTIFNSNPRDMISSSHLMHVHGAYKSIHVGMCICIVENRRFQSL